MKSLKITNGIKGTVNIPGDKSISHRSVIIPSISYGVSTITNILKSEDVLNTINAFDLMGVKIEEKENSIIIKGNGLKSLKKPIKEIYLGNSGTSARLLTGLLASQKFDTIITGDKSLSSRPMKRIIDPLKKMGAEVESENGTLPLTIKGQNLNNIIYEIPVPSAQVKSSLILAALGTSGKTEIIENNITRDHTEIMLKSFEADIDITKKNNYKKIIINGNKELKSKNIEVPSDLSSSAFFIVATLINKNSILKLKNININPSRDGILKALNLMGASIKIENKKLINEELVADIEIKSSELNGCELDANMSKLMIDEYPILSIAACFAKSPSIFRGLEELRIKESDRLELIRLNLNNCGVECKIIKDDLFIKPTKNYVVNNNIIKTNYDHRIAMSFAVMGTMLDTELIISDSDSINTSFPNFIKSFNSVGGKLIE
tara:strand:- start:606 stop:1910 length:1305 start_codon:yes stop_codon:yes gene_type:complete